MTFLFPTEIQRQLCAATSWAVQMVGSKFMINVLEPVEEKVRGGGMRRRRLQPMNSRRKSSVVSTPGHELVWAFSMLFEL